MLDAAGRKPVDVWLVFRNIEDPRSSGWRWLRHGFQHVEAWRHDRGAWARYDPCTEFSLVAVELAPPWRVVAKNLAPTFLRCQRLVQPHRIRAPFHVGPITCVDGAKSLLGLWAPLVLTPYQLYRHMIKERQRGRK